MLKKYILWIAVGFAFLTIAAFLAALGSDGFLSNAFLGIFSAFLSVTLALILVNIFIDQRSRRVAAAPLARLVSPPIIRFHNDFITWGRDRFGTARFNAMIDTYQDNGHDPVAFSPEERSGMSDMIDKNRDGVEKHFGIIDARMSDLIDVLGWSFDAKIISAALDCKQNIAEFLANIEPLDELQRNKRVEMYLDTDAASGAVLQRLYEVLGRELQFGDKPPSN